MPALVTETQEMSSAMMVDAEDIKALSDDEIFQRLKELGAEVGPIIASTRSVYERKLYRMMSGESALDHGDSPMNGSRFSESETDETPLKMQGARRRHTTPPRPESLQDECIVPETPPPVPVPAPAYVPPATPVSSELPESPYFATARRALHSDGRRSVDSELSNSSFTRYRERRQIGFQYSHANAMSKDASAAANAKKSNSLFVTCFEIFMLTFLVVVGYVFYTEIQTYSAAEQEYIDSNEQSFPGDN